MEKVLGLLHSLPGFENVELHKSGLDAVSLIFHLFNICLPTQMVLIFCCLGLPTANSHGCTCIRHNSDWLLVCSPSSGQEPAAS
jgi:hypothetical protein